MPHQFSSIAFTPSVQRVQDAMGSRHANDLRIARGMPGDELGDYERAFLAERDSFYIATVSETGWPYVQHRGGPTGFVNVLDSKTLAFADVTGNRQYISTGNLDANDRIALFFMDYPQQTRLKLLGHAEILPWTTAPGWKTGLLLPPKARPERVYLVHVVATDWNCPQHIVPRWTAEEVLSGPIGERLAALEAENQNLRAQLS